jgi:hypothetical protein
MRVGKPYTVHTLFTINNKRLLKTIYPRKEKNGYTKREIEHLVGRLQNRIKSDDVQMMVSVNIPKLGFRSGRNFGKADTIELPDTYNFHEASSFVVYYYK